MTRDWKEAQSAMKLVPTWYRIRIGLYVGFGIGVSFGMGTLFGYLICHG